MHILGSWTALYDSGESVAFTTGRLLATRLASVDWEPPEAVLPVLRKGAKTEASVIKDYHPPDHAQGLADKAMEAMFAPKDESDWNLGLWMQRIPPMARQVIAEYFFGSNRNCNLRPELSYGDRKYGCCAELNRAHVEWVGCFEPPGDEAKVPQGLTIKDLSEALLAAGADVKKGQKKAKLVEAVRQRQGLMSSLYAQKLPDYRVPKEEWRVALGRWARRCEDLEPIGRLILKSLAMQSLRVRPK